jgi:2'-hydroxyisoflavone reductase
MKLLLLGGTVFLGRHLAAAALAAGHTVTLFNRGRSGHPPAGAATITGDRTVATDMATLAAQSWDAVIERIAQPEEAALSGETYGALKAVCEEAVAAALPGRTLIIRPGLIVGPYDPSDRFSYWPLRCAGGGVILCPGDPAEPVQFIDVRDLAAWIIRQVEERTTGIFNATGPAAPLSFGALIDCCLAETASGGQPIWAPDSVLEEAQIAAYTEMPLWVPATLTGFNRTAIDRALAAGLTFRPLAETVADTLAWRQATVAEHPLKAGLTVDKERELLAQLGR